MLGGGGSPSPHPELYLELLSLASLGIWAIGQKSPGQPNPIDRPLWIGVALFSAIPIIQLIPMPPSLWHMLPGRAGEISALALINEETSWRPISLSPFMTLSSILSLIPPITILFFVSRATLDERTRILATVASVGVAAGFAGVLQVASGNAGWLMPYPREVVGFATGFQANRNAGADVFLITILALAAYCSIKRDLLRTAIGKIAFAAFSALLTLMTILSGSRAGSALLLVVAASAATLLVRRLDRRRIAIFAVGAIVVIGGFAATWNNAQIERTWSRFSHQPEARPELWRDTIFAIKELAPVGSGVGTFQPVMEEAERLEAVDVYTPNRAHNDYLEYALEAGVAGIVAVIGGVIALAMRAVGILRVTRSNRQRAQAICGIGILAILGLHSLVDYPMRSMAVAGLAAAGIGFLSRVAVGRGEIREFV
ncbi:MAG: O-antigen ligase family protein [Sphingomonas sp.]